MPARCSGCLDSWLFYHLVLGGITNYTTLKQNLSTHIQTPRFSLYADQSIPLADLERWAFRHEFYLQNLLDTLDVEWPEGKQIESFIYANEWQKKATSWSKGN